MSLNGKIVPWNGRNVYKYKQNKIDYTCGIIYDCFIATPSCNEMEDSRMYIRIIKTPPGRAPERIRQMWIGIVLPSQGREADPTSGEFRIGDENRGGYVVTGRDALRELREYNHEAFVWWFGTFPHLGLDGKLVFATDVCEEIIWQ